MSPLRRVSRRLSSAFGDDNFLKGLGSIETLVSKALSIAMVVVLLVAVLDLFVFLFQELFLNWEGVLVEPLGFFTGTLFEIFGLFLDVLIALEILENVTAYLKKHVVQVELVIVTSLTAIARKIIIFDFNKAGGVELIGLAIAIFALSISYWIIRRLNAKSQT
ncbi:MAG: phosphate-starvation-inducible PsiE family protein [Synechococcales bacterium]|nr:phosphate-starvation-inducible PsiE family protein [Synechococcales bacterium]